MIVHQVYALILNEKVENIFVCDNYEMANHVARAGYGNEAFAIDCLQYPCMIGDIYRDGVFYHADTVTGEESVIEYVPTESQQISMLQEELLRTQLALLEVYESKGGES